MGSPISFLAGVWRGSGAGEFPTMDGFAYDEEIRFTDLGVPSLVYQQRAWSATDGEILHLETGIWRASPEGALAVTVALPRVTEVSEGHLAGETIRLATTSVRRAAGGRASWRWSAHTRCEATRSGTGSPWRPMRWPASPITSPDRFVGSKVSRA